MSSKTDSGGRGVKVLKLFQRELATGWRLFVALAFFSGVSNAAVLAAINIAANSPHDSDTMAGALVMLGIAIVVYIVSQKALMMMAANLAESTVGHLRTSFLEKLQSADLVDVESLNRTEIYTCVGAEMQVMADGTLTLMIIGQALVLVVVTMLYLAWLSLPALILSTMFIALAASIYLTREKEVTQLLQGTFQLESRLMDSFVDLVEGFKEMKLSRRRSRELGDCVRNLSAEVADNRLTTRDLFTGAFVASQVAFFLLTGIMVFVVPMISTLKPDTLIMITTTSLFLIGPVTTVVGGLPVLQRVNSAVDSILSLEARLAQMSRPKPDDDVTAIHFERIALEAAIFRYSGVEGEAGFQVGPLDMEIQRGQIVFITGGNGSGKSTLLKLITGLYLPTAGTIKLDSEALPVGKVISYRNLFSAIFSDYHLFKELYGVPRINADKAAELFELLEMEHKAHIVGRAFDTIALSSGQKKRLALLSLLLEDRPICVFDEWAADQDPHFREKFYRVILQRLRQGGKTIIAVTHDERYFDVADFRVHLEEGRLHSVSVQEAPSVDV
jgi:putative pyoverdin transport system ATP-binding/permease protein